MRKRVDRGSSTTTEAAADEADAVMTAEVRSVMGDSTKTSSWASDAGPDPKLSTLRGEATELEVMLPRRSLSCKSLALPK